MTRTGGHRDSLRKDDGKTPVVVWIVLAVILFLLLRMTWTRVFPQPAVRYVDNSTSSPDQLKLPLRGSVDVKNAGKKGYLYFYLKLTDADGREIRSLVTPNGRPAAPKVEIYSKMGNGEKVYSCTLEYG